MKKKAAVLLLLTALTLSACGNNDQGEVPTQSNEATTEESFVSTKEDENSSDLDTLAQIEVDEGLFDVELTIPAEFIGDQTQADLDALAEEYGFKAITLNSDGSATYIMTKKQHEEFLADYREQINDSLQELVGSDNYPNFTKIEANENFTEFTVTTKSTELDLSESFSVIAFYMYGGMYNIFSGEEVDNIVVTFVNDTTGEIISTSNSKDM